MLEQAFRALLPEASGKNQGEDEKPGDAIPPEFLIQGLGREFMLMRPVPQRKPVPARKAEALVNGLGDFLEGTSNSTGEGTKSASETE